MVRFATTFLVLVGPTYPLFAQDLPSPLIRAHAHNDYLHDKPLLDALSHGFCSVEADIFLVNGKLLVAHSIFELSSDRTLEDLYLKPLQQRCKQNGGRIYKDGPAFTLLIDIKAYGVNAYRALHELLSQYRDVFSYMKDGTFHELAVNAVISGDRPIEAITEGDFRIVGIDGRLGDLGSDLPAHLMPLISDNWRNHFKWRGVGEFSQEERSRLKAIVEKAHAKGRRVRFWSSADTPAMWQVLNEARVDLINTDDLPGLSRFLRTEANSE